MWAKGYLIVLRGLLILATYFEKYPVLGGSSSGFCGYVDGLCRVV